MGTDRAPTLVNSAVLRGMADSDVAAIILKGKGRMPAFPLPQADIDQIVRYIRSRNLAAAAETAVPGDAKAGESIFFGEGQCSSCHTAGGRGSSYGPDLSSIASRLRLANLQQALANPGASSSSGGGGGFGAAPATYNSVTVVLKDGSKLQGLNRAQGSHDLVLQTSDGKLHLLQDGEYLSVVPDSTPAMPAYQGTADQMRDLLAYLSTLKGVGVGALTAPQPPSPRPRSTRSRIPGREIGRPTTALWTGTATAGSIRSICRTRQSCNCSGPTRSSSSAWRRPRWWWMG